MVLMAGDEDSDLHQITGTLGLSGSIASTPDTVGTGLPGGSTINSCTLVTFIDDSNAPHSGERLFLTLATGAHVGQLKIITMTGPKSGADNPRLTKSDGNLATNIGTNGITWSGVGDSVTLVYNGSKWAIAGSFGTSID